MDSTPQKIGKIQKLSIIIPSYNLEDYIAETLKSIASQTKQFDYEILLIDNQSTDNTLKIVSEIASTNHRIHIFHNKFKKGASSTRNIGIQHCTGNWVTFLDGDDTWGPEMFTELENAIEKYPEAKLISCNFNFLDHNTKTTKSDIDIHYQTHFSAALKNNTPIQLDNLAEIFFRDGALTRTGALFIERSCLIKAGLFDESLAVCEDTLMWLRLAMITNSMVFIPKPLLNYRIRAGSLTNQGQTISEWNYIFYKKISRMSEFERYQPHILNRLHQNAAKRAYFFRERKMHKAAIISSLQWTYLNPTNIRAWKCLLSALIFK